jgi:Beta-lactamase enzyme family
VPARPAAAALAVIVTLALGPAAARAAEPWHPDVAAARAWAAQRAGTVSFAVRTEHRLYGWHVNRAYPSASVVKAMLLVAYLHRPSVRDRPLTAADHALLSPMIRRSDNDAATRVRNIVGNGRLVRLARRVGMTRFAPAVSWGSTQITARDQTKFFRHIDRFMPPRHRAYGMRLLRTIIPAQRWGIAQVVPAGWTLYFKGGWGAGTGAVDHQIGLLRRGDERVSIAVLTVGNPTHAYGEATERGVARRLLRGLARTTEGAR